MTDTPPPVPPIADMPPPVPPIVALWQEGRLPIEDALHLAPGHSYAVDLTPGRSYAVDLVPGTPSGLVLVEEFDLGQVLAEDPDWVTAIDVQSPTPLPSGGSLVRGEGSHGSEGFVARLDPAGQLVWVIYLSESNPFETVEVNGTLGTFTSTSGITITLDIEDPLSTLTD